MGALPSQPPGTVHPSEEPAPLQFLDTNGRAGIEIGEDSGLKALDLNAAVTVPAVPWAGAKPGKCYLNVNRFVLERGGVFVSGWALADAGPMIKSDLGAKPLYHRWIHHLIWEDFAHKLWEVTPYFDVHNHEDIAWAPTTFILDRAAIPLMEPDGFCLMQPARYTAARPEGRDVAKCLNALERDGSRYETYWLQQAVHALKLAGYGKVEWHIERIDGRINNVWLFAS